MKNNLTSVEQYTEKITILSDLYDELKKQGFDTDEEAHYINLKMRHIKDQIIKITFKIKREAQLMEEL